MTQLAVPTWRWPRHAMIDRREAADIIDRMLAKEPTESMDPADPMEPMLSTDPTDPIDRNEFVDPMLSIELRE